MHKNAIIIGNAGSRVSKFRQYVNVSGLMSIQKNLKFVIKFPDFYEFLQLVEKIVIRLKFLLL